MQIVIDVDDEFYDAIKDGYIEPCDTDYALSCVLNGIPLPEHHGRLIDIDALDNTCPAYRTDDDGSYCYKWKDIDAASTIIPATKEGE